MNILEQKVQKKINGLFPNVSIDVRLEVASSKVNADLTYRGAFVIAKSLKKSPQEIAEQICSLCATISDFSEVVAVNGHVNFILSEKFWKTFIDEVNSKKIIWEKKKTKNSIQLEFISANPTGPLTMGNGRGGFVGDTLARVLGRAGNEVEKEYYVNDAGNQIQILARSIKKSLGIDHEVVSEQQDFYKGDYIDAIARELKKTKGLVWLKKSSLDPLGKIVAQKILNGLIKKDLKFIGITFDHFQSERELYKTHLIEKTWKILKAKKAIYEKDNAVWLKTTKYGDEKDRVVQTSDGKPTYFMADLAYLYKRLHIEKYTKVIMIVGADHHGYIPRMLAGAQFLGYPNALTIYVSQLVRLIQDGVEIRMSKRKGVYVTLREVVEDIGHDAARYFFLSRALDSHMDIDLAIAKEQSNRNPIYYIQYMSARIASVKKKVPKKYLKNDNCDLDNVTIYEKELLKMLFKYTEIMNEVEKTHLVNMLTQYAYELASSYHIFYENCRILGDPHIARRVTISRAAEKILHELLYIMGITPKSVL